MKNKLFVISSAILMILALVLSGTLAEKGDLVGFGAYLLMGLTNGLVVFASLCEDI